MRLRDVFLFLNAASWANFSGATLGDRPLDCHRLLALGSFASNPRVAFEQAREALPIVLDQIIWHSSMSEADRDLVVPIHKALIDEKAPLEYLSFSAHPERFAHLGPTRAAATGNHVGDTVYVNLDVIRELDRKQILALLIHEYGHHHGVRDEDHRLLDTLAAKIVEEIKFESHALPDVYMPRARVTTFQIERRPYHTTIGHAKHRDDIGPIATLSREDYGYGTHLLVSDGRTEFNLRELLLTSFVPERRLIDLQMESKGWRLDETTSEQHPELVLNLDVSFNPEAKPYINLEVRFPLIWFMGKYQFARGVPASVRQVELPERNLLNLVRREFFLGTIDSEVPGQNVIVRELEDRVEVEMTFRGRVNPLTWRLFPTYRAYWGQSLVVDGTEIHSLLPYSHPLMSQGKVELFDMEEDKTRAVITIAPQDHSRGDLRFVGLALFGQFSHPTQPISLGRMIVPELLPMLAKTATPAPNTAAPLRHVGGGQETEITLSINSRVARDFDLTVEVPDDFPIRTDADLKLFDHEHGGSMRVLLEEPNINYNYSMHSPTLIGHNVGVFFRGTENLAAHPELSMPGATEPRKLRLPLSMALNPSLYPDVQHTIRYNTHHAPTELTIKGIFLQTADLRSWYLPVRVHVNFDHSGMAPVPRDWILFSADNKVIQQDEMHEVLEAARRR